MEAGSMIVWGSNLHIDRITSWGRRSHSWKWLLAATGQQSGQDWAVGAKGRVDLTVLEDSWRFHLWHQCVAQLWLLGKSFGIKHVQGLLNKNADVTKQEALEVSAVASAVVQQRSVRRVP